MILSRRWLEALLGRPLDATEVALLLTNHCSPVEGVTPVHQDLGDVLVARVLEVRKHPNADRLSLCLVDAGGAAPLEVVCGAPNVTAGKMYPFAPVGAVLPGGLTLDRRKIRGVESNGMLCSAKELGLGADAGGILELDTAAAPGARFLEAIPVADDRIELEVFSNRPDLLGHKGVARELAAQLGATVKLPAIPGAPTAPSAKPPIRQSAQGVVDGLTVRLEDPEGAPRYLMAVVRGVRVGPSPAWLAQRLESVGQRAINNVVDATNYILLELNQPLHAFDLARLRGRAVVVRRARPGETMVTLDGVSRSLNPEMTVICDAERPTIVAGVMGSAESEVTAETTDLVVECAYFQPTRIRRTRRALGLSSESSYRFERGIDMLGMPDAMRRALELIVAVAGGAVREPPLDLWPAPQAPRTVFLRPDRVSRVLGTEVPRGDLERLLSSVGFVAAPKDGRIAAQVPGWRPDVTREVDLIEEIARLRGFDAFPDELRAYRPTLVPDAPIEGAKTTVRAALAAAGMLEARTFPLGRADAPDAVAVLNPLSAEEAHLRSRLLPGLVRRVEHNWSLTVRDVRLFEIGTAFRAGAATAPPVEHVAVAGILTGARQPGHWSDGGKVSDMDIWDLKGHFELALRVASPGARLQVAENGWEAVAPDGNVVGRAGPLDADRPAWAAPVFGFEMRLEAPEAGAVVTHRPPPATPAVERDLALVLGPGVSAAQVEDVIRGAAGPLLERLAAFDEYRGGGIAAGRRGVAWRCTFRDPSRTLREAEVEEALARVMHSLEERLDVRRRES